jgi:hypothetical protein
VYQAKFKGQHHELGTSGFLYRSNKLMYDHATKSFWSTLKGEPVVGPLVGKGIQLQREHVVTTTWGDWKRLHPETTVLSLNTGHERDYGEGVAYRDYFATHDLMFDVPKSDKRLRNKDEILGLRDDGNQLAISAAFLNKKPVYQSRVGNQSFVVVTDRSGANRVYEVGENQFKSLKGDTVVDQAGGEWKVAESALIKGSTKLKRLPAHRAFWFGWVAQFPETRLVK